MLGSLKNEVPAQVRKADQTLVIAGRSRTIVGPQRRGGGKCDQWKPLNLKETAPTTVESRNEFPLGFFSKPDLN
jgi:hypothetical protein